jgi:hypothetical protein
MAGAAVSLTGAAKKKNEPPPPKVEETISSVANIVGRDIDVEGVGLVINLDDTGSDPAPSQSREKLLADMKKADIPHPERILRSPTVSMVIIRAKFPSGVTTEDKFDVDIELPPASTTTSLAGGWLLSTPLAFRASTAEGDKDGKVLAYAMGPVMTGNAAKPDNLKVGRVLGGGRGKEDSPYALYIKETRRSGKTSKLIESVIQQRFHQSEGNDRKGMALAKTDFQLFLKVPKNYHHNQTRYHQVIKLLPLVDNPQLREQRIANWGKDLLDPKKAGVAALKLEGIGPGAGNVLKAALESKDETVRFFAAEALAYLNDGAGSKVLYETVKNKPEFRAFALKAMAAMDQSSCLLKLRALMNEPEYEVRYGAFNALRTLDPADPFLGKVGVMDDPKEEDALDHLAFQISDTPKRKPRPRPDEPFALYVVDCEGPPMVHISRNMRCEIVVFGKNQKLLPPVVLGAGGPILLNASDGDGQVQISKITSKNLDAVSNRVNSPLELAEVIRRMANLGASYPEIAAVLNSAAAQKNLPGPYVVDAIPAVNKAYDEAQLAGEMSRKDDGLKKASFDDDEKRPGMFSRVGKLFGR